MTLQDTNIAPLPAQARIDQALRVQVARMEGPEAHALRQGNHGPQAGCVEMIPELFHEH
jgi:hypothetical protein